MPLEFAQGLRRFPYYIVLLKPPNLALTALKVSGLAAVSILHSASETAPCNQMPVLPAIYIPVSILHSASETKMVVLPKWWIQGEFPYYIVLLKLGESLTGKTQIISRVFPYYIVLLKPTFISLASLCCNSSFHTT